MIINLELASNYIEAGTIATVFYVYKLLLFLLPYMKSTGSG